MIKLGDFLEGCRVVQELIKYINCEPNTDLYLIEKLIHKHPLKEIKKERMTKKDYEKANSIINSYLDLDMNELEHYVALNTNENNPVETFNTKNYYNMSMPEAYALEVLSSVVTLRNMRGTKDGLNDKIHRNNQH